MSEKKRQPALLFGHLWPGKFLLPLSTVTIAREAQARYRAALSMTLPFGSQAEKTPKVPNEISYSEDE
jgi:hypothetical protein